VGSSAVAALVAYVTFWTLVVWGWAVEEISRATAIVFVALWFAGSVAAGFVPYGEGLFPSYIAILDIVLVFLVCKGDVRLR
jgi:hypothetical protein